MPHRPGKDLRSCPHAERTATVLHAFVPALIRRAGEQAASDGLPDPATQADAEVASITSSSTDVMEERRMHSIVRRCSRRKVIVIRNSEFGFRNGLPNLSSL
jgi:hypothetical protein